MSKLTSLGPYSRDCLEAFDLIDIDQDVVAKIHKAEGRAFTPLGNIMLMGEPIAAGIKKRHVWEVRQRVARELYLADKLLTKFPERINTLPAFTFAVVTETGRKVGILTEDFTCNGTRSLDETSNRFGISGRTRREYAPEGLHRDVYDALNGRVYPEAFRHMIGFAFDREVLIDYDDVASPSTQEMFNYGDLVSSMAIVIADEVQ